MNSSCGSIHLDFCNAFSWIMLLIKSRFVVVIQIVGLEVHEITAAHRMDWRMTVDLLAAQLNTKQEKT